MSVFEWCASILGVLGFALGVSNLAWMIRKQSPRLAIDVPVARMFKASMERQSIVPGRTSRDVMVLELLVAVSNVSQVRNTVVSIQSEQPYKVVAFEGKDVLIVGERTVDISRIGLEDKIQTSPLYFRPQDPIVNKLPTCLAEGECVDGRLSGEIKNGDSPVEDSFDLVVVAKDAHGRRYRKKVRVNREESIAQNDYPLGEGVCPTIKVCSK